MMFEGHLIVGRYLEFGHAFVSGSRHSGYGCRRYKPVAASVDYVGKAMSGSMSRVKRRRKVEELLRSCSDFLPPSHPRRFLLS
jgi:hypothetical protein